MPNSEQKNIEAKLAKAKKIAATVLNKLFFLIEDDHPGLMEEIKEVKLEDVINRIL